MSALDRLLGTWEFTMHHSAMSERVTGRRGSSGCSTEPSDGLGGTTPGVADEARRRV